MWHRVHVSCFQLLSAVEGTCTQRHYKLRIHLNDFWAITMNKSWAPCNFFYILVHLLKHGQCISPVKSECTLVVFKVASQSNYGNRSTTTWSLKFGMNLRKQTLRWQDIISCEVGNIRNPYSSQLGTLSAQCLDCLPK